MTKICSKCFCEKFLGEFYPNKRYVLGHYNLCRDCCAICERQRAPARRAYHSSEARRAACLAAANGRTTKTCYKCNCEKLFEQFPKNPSGPCGRGTWCKDCAKGYRQTNMSAHLARQRSEPYKEKRRQNSKRRRLADIQFKLGDNLRRRLNKMLQGKTKVSSMLVLLGCSLPELQAHLETQFQPGMTRNNHGKGPGKWNVDHIRPCASFPDLTDPTQQAQCFHYTNLQPMWEPDNLRKGAKYRG